MSQRCNQPTLRQLQYLRTLAERTATTFASPRTRGEASREIRRLEALPSTRSEEPHERSALADARARLRPSSTIAPEEVTGYSSRGGPSAKRRWRVSPKIAWERSIDLRIECLIEFGPLPRRGVSVDFGQLLGVARGPIDGALRDPPTAPSAAARSSMGAGVPLAKRISSTSRSRCVSRSLLVKRMR